MAGARGRAARPCGCDSSGPGRAPRGSGPSARAARRRRDRGLDELQLVALDERARASRSDSRKKRCVSSSTDVHVEAELRDHVDEHRRLLLPGARQAERVAELARWAQRMTSSAVMASKSTSGSCELRSDAQSARAACSPRSTSFRVSARRPRRSVSSGMTSSGGMLPRLTSGPKCFTNHAWEAFVGASKMRSLEARSSARSRRRGRCASRRRPVDAGGAALAALGDHLPGAGVELLADPLRPTGTARSPPRSPSSRPPRGRRSRARARRSARACARAAARSSRPRSRRARSGSRSSQRLYSSSLSLRDDGLEERPAAHDRRLERAVERDLLLEVVRDVRRPPAELDDVDVLAGGVEEPLDLAEVQPLVDDVRQAARRAASARASGRRGTRCRQSRA